MLLSFDTALQKIEGARAPRPPPPGFDATDMKTWNISYTIIMVFELSSVDFR